MPVTTSVTVVCIGSLRRPTTISTQQREGPTSSALLVNAGAGLSLLDVAKMIPLHLVPVGGLQLCFTHCGAMRFHIRHPSAITAQVQTNKTVLYRTLWEGEKTLNHLRSLTENDTLYSKAVKFSLWTVLGDLLNGIQWQLTSNSAYPLPCSATSGWKLVASTPLKLPRWLCIRTPQPWIYTRAQPGVSGCRFFRFRKGASKP